MSSSCNWGLTGLSPAFEILSSIFAVQRNIVVLLGIVSQCEKWSLLSRSGQTSCYLSIMSVFGPSQRCATSLRGSLVRLRRELNAARFASA